MRASCTISRRIITAGIGLDYALVVIVEAGDRRHRRGKTDQAALDGAKLSGLSNGPDQAVLARLRYRYFRG